MSEDEPVDSPTGEYRKETVNLEGEKEADTIDMDITMHL